MLRRHGDVACRLVGAVGMFLALGAWVQAQAQQGPLRGGDLLVEPAWLREHLRA